MTALKRTLYRYVKYLTIISFPTIFNQLDKNNGMGMTYILITKLLCQCVNKSSNSRNRIEYGRFLNNHFLSLCNLSLTRSVYYLRVRDFAQILEHVFGSENMKEATVVDPNALKKSSYEYFEFYFYKMVKNRLFFKKQ